MISAQTRRVCREGKPLHTFLNQMGEHVRREHDGAWYALALDRVQRLGGLARPSERVPAHALELALPRQTIHSLELSRRLWTLCAEREVRFLYASSASTYGNGSAGFEDDNDPVALAKLRPLSLYGWTKHAFDLNVVRRLAVARERPPQWAG